MGHVAEMILIGMFCEQCGSFMDGETPGFPRKCDDCSPRALNKYQVFVDVSETWEEDDIDVVSIVVEEENASLARIKATEEIVRGKHNDLIKGRDYYVWDVTEDDKVQE